MDFEGLCRKFAPQGEKEELFKLARLSRGMFIGRTKSVRFPGREVIFTLWTPNRVGEIGFVLKNDPSFETRMIEAYRVEDATYDGVITENEGSPQEAA